MIRRFQIRFVALCLLIISGCGIHTQETVDLSYAISHFTEQNDKLTQKAIAGEELTPDEVDNWKSTSEALVRNTEILSEILGKPSKKAQDALSKDGLEE